MENAQPPMLTTATPLSFIILPTSSTLQNLQPLTVITTTALNSLQHGTSFTVGSHGNTGTTLTALPVMTSCLPTTLTTSNAANNVTMTSLPLASVGGQVVSAGNSSSTTKTGYSTGTPPLKPAKKFRSEQEEILRCKRRLDFVGSMGLQRPHVTTVLRRNERERNRVKLINNTFLRLREHLPGTTARTSKGKTKKLSKVDTLQKAIDYIHALQDLIDEHDAVDAVFDQQERTSGYTSSTISTSCASSTSSASSVVSEDGLLSPGSAGESEMLSDEAPLSPEEADLLDFTNWFCP